MIIVLDPKMRIKLLWRLNYSVTQNFQKLSHLKDYFISKYYKYCYLLNIYFSILSLTIRR